MTLSESVLRSKKPTKQQKLKSLKAKVIPGH